MGVDHHCVFPYPLEQVVGYDLWTTTVDNQLTITAMHALEYSRQIITATVKYSTAALEYSRWTITATIEYSTATLECSRWTITAALLHFSDVDCL